MANKRRLEVSVRLHQSLLTTRSDLHSTAVMSTAVVAAWQVEVEEEERSVPSCLSNLPLLLPAKGRCQLLLPESTTRLRTVDPGSTVDLRSATKPQGRRRRRLRLSTLLSCRLRINSPVWCSKLHRVLIRLNSSLVQQRRTEVSVEKKRRRRLLLSEVVVQVTSFTVQCRFTIPTRSCS